MTWRWRGACSAVTAGSSAPGRARPCSARRWHAATWLANTLTARGAELAAGSIILTGSITAAVPVAAGDTVTVTIDGLGSVTAVFD